MGIECSFGGERCRIWILTGERVAVRGGREGVSRFADRIGEVPDGPQNRFWADIHMGPEGAVRSFRALGGHGLLMPIHWGLFDLALHEWRQPIEKVVAVEGLKLWSPTPGIPTEVVQDQEIRSNWWR